MTTTHARGMQSWKEEGRSYYRVSGPLAAEMLVNEFVYQDGDSPLQATTSGEISSQPQLLAVRPEHMTLHTERPQAGEHNEEILRAAGYPDAQIDRLKAAGILG